VHALARLYDAERAAEDDPLGFVMAASGFDLAVTQRSGNRSLGLTVGVIRDVYAGQVYAAVAPTGPASAGEIAQLVIAGHGAFLEAARRRDGAMARSAWSNYLASTGPLLIDPERARQPIDSVPLWRPHNHVHLPRQPDRLAEAIADEIRARIAEGRLADGDRLSPLPELAQEFGVSRPTLREVLRTLEMEFLVDLRAGDRNGPRIRHPSPRVAAQLAGTIFQSRQTTVGDFLRALAMIEPSMIEIAVARADPTSLATLHALAAELAAPGADWPAMLEIWTRARKAAFGAAGNPALTVVAEILHWIRIGAKPDPALTAVADPVWLAETSRLVASFTDLLAAFVSGDGPGAARIWARSLGANAPDLEFSQLDRRLVIDLVGDIEGAPSTPQTLG
jgi:DNA-binding FadR family transcriptional regulator